MAPILLSTMLVRLVTSVRLPEEPLPSEPISIMVAESNTATLVKLKLGTAWETRFLTAWALSTVRTLPPCMVTITEAEAEVPESSPMAYRDSPPITMVTLAS